MNAQFWLEDNSCLSMRLDDSRVEILLHRKPRPIPLVDCRAGVRGRTVLVTGAGGYIGAAICRTLAGLEADRVVALDISENSLASLLQESQESFWPCRLEVELCDIRDLDRLRRVLRVYRPVHIYHAAAYKHVPLLEELPFDAIENNSLATWRIACLAAEEAMERFVLVSSDKAAGAGNVLGESKRLAELFIGGIARLGCRFTAVRCGNVLGSPGSVLPRFIGQILRGRPITICDRFVERYFMTVEEAAHAVVKAGNLTDGGDILIPDIGPPVLIVDLARRLLSRLPLSTRRRVRIQFTGLRPGDQMRERLVAENEEVLPTSCSSFVRVWPFRAGYCDLDWLASELADCCRRRDRPALQDCIRRAHSAPRAFSSMALEFEKV
jgi:FlaA1/EpsC-like NDP-sugar epimerase